MPAILEITLKKAFIFKKLCLGADKADLILSSDWSVSRKLCSEWLVILLKDEFNFWLLLLHLKISRYSAGVSFSEGKVLFDTSFPHLFCLLNKKYTTFY